MTELLQSHTPRLPSFILGNQCSNDQKYKPTRVTDISSVASAYGAFGVSARMGLLSVMQLHRNPSGLGLLVELNSFGSLQAVA